MVCDFRILFQNHCRHSEASTDQAGSCHAPLRLGSILSRMALLIFLTVAMAHGASEEFWEGKLAQLTEDLKENAQSLQKQTDRVKEDAASDGKTSDGKDWWDTSFNPKLQKQIDLVNKLEENLHQYLDVSQAFQKVNRVQDLWKELKIAEKEEHAQQGDVQALQGLIQGKLQILQAQKQKAQEENNMAHKELEDLQGKLQTLQAQKQKAQEENNMAHKELEDLQGKLQILQAQKQKAQEENNMAHKELEDLQGKLQTLQAQKQKAQEENNMAHKELEDLQGKLQILQAQKQKAQEENNMAHKELEDLQGKLQILQAQKQKAQEENNMAHKELEDLQGKLQTLQAQKQKAQEENNMAHKELEYIQIRSAGRTLRAKNQELQQWQQRFMVVTVLSIVGLVAWVCQLVRKTRRLPEGTQNTQPLLDRSVEEQLLRNSASVLSILNQVRCILAHLRGDSPWHFVDDPEHPAD